MRTILDRIIETKLTEVEEAKGRRSLAQLRAMIGRAAPPRDFYAAVTAPSPYGINLIAEIKKASPSAGIIVDNFDPTRIATTYQKCGAAAISVLTDETFFAGQLGFIERVKEAVPLPVLRKDFIIDEYQVYESRAAGSDAILLIAEVLEANRIAELHRLSYEHGMATLVEVHSAGNLRMVLERLGPPGTDSYILGINNRDLSSQHTDVANTAKVAALLPGSVPFVAESGIATRADVLEIKAAGACAMLVGESILRAPDIGAHIAVLLAE